MDLFVLYLQLTLIIWFRYFLVSGIFYALLWGRPADKVSAQPLSRTPPTAKIMRHEIGLSIFSSLIYAVPGALLVHLWLQGGTAIYSDVSAMGGPILGWLYLPVSVFVYLAIQDAHYYWLHRAMHHERLFKATHLSHHRSRRPTPWAAFSFHPWETVLSAWVIPALAFIVPIHVYAVLALLTIMTYCSVANHAGWEIVPPRLLNGFIGKHLITARHHDLHHTNYKANFGLYFRFWDRLMGTDRGFAPVVEKDAPS